VAVRCKVYVCGSSIAGTAGSNPSEDTDGSLLCFLCVVEVVAPATGWYSLGGVLSGVCLIVCDLEISTLKRSRLEFSCDARKPF
jgi:hypothetical protein